MNRFSHLSKLVIVVLLASIVVSSCGKKKVQQDEKIDKIKSRIESLKDVPQKNNLGPNYPQKSPEEIEAYREQRKQEQEAELSRKKAQDRENVYSKYRKIFKTYYFLNNQGLASEAIVFDVPNSQGRGRGALNALFDPNPFSYQIQEDEDKIHITFDNKNRAIVTIYDDCLYISINGEDYRFSKTLRDK